MKTLQTRLCAAVVGCLMAACAAQANLIVNGDFETGDFTGWATSGNINDYTGVMADSSLYYVHSGTYGAYLGPVGPLGYLSQTLLTVPGQFYDISWWLMSDGGTPNELRVEWNGTVVYSATDIPESGWVQHTVTVSAVGPTTDFAAFGFRNDPGWLYLDDINVEVSTVPEPSTYLAGALMLLPLGATVIRSVRRKCKA